MHAQAVAWCIQHLTEVSPEARDAVRENGTLPLLVGILRSSTEASARERAAWAICNAATKNPENRAAFRQAPALAWANPSLSVYLGLGFHIQR